MWRAIRHELAEVVWLASIIGGLSVLGIGLAFGAAAALSAWEQLPALASHA